MENRGTGENEKQETETKDTEQKLKQKQGKGEEGNRGPRGDQQEVGGRGGRCSVLLTMRCFNDAIFSNS